MTTPTLPQRLRTMADHTGLDAVAELLRESAAALERERASRQAAQIENESLKDRIARSGVEQQRAVREATQRLHIENEGLREALKQNAAKTGQVTYEEAMMFAKLVGMKFSAAQFSGVLECETADFEIHALCNLVASRKLLSEPQSALARAGEVK